MTAAVARPGDMQMDEAFELAGYFGAHAIWCVSDGETLIPMLAVQHLDGSRGMTRFEDSDMQRAVDAARSRLESDRAGKSRAVLLYDGYVTLEKGKTDAILVEMVDYSTNQRAAIALAYRPASHAAGFAVFRPKILSLPESCQSQAAGEALFRGAYRHEQGAALWTRYLDESQ